MSRKQEEKYIPGQVTRYLTLSRRGKEEEEKTRHYSKSKGGHVSKRQGFYVVEQ